MEHVRDSPGYMFQRWAVHLENIQRNERRLGFASKYIFCCAIFVKSKFCLMRLRLAYVLKEDGLKIGLLFDMLAQFTVTIFLPSPDNNSQDTTCLQILMAKNIFIFCNNRCLNGLARVKKGGCSTSTSISTGRTSTTSLH
jgi:hypothetical protein